MDNKDISKELLHFLEEYRWALPGNFSKDTEILEDMKLSGDDAGEFLVDFGKSFNVDLSGFEFDKYFYPEGDLILPAIMDFIFRIKRSPKVKLTIGDLEKAIKTKKLV